MTELVARLQSGAAGVRMQGMFERATWPLRKLTWLIEEKVLWPLADALRKLTGRSYAHVRVKPEPLDEVVPQPLEAAAAPRSRRPRHPRSRPPRGRSTAASSPACGIVSGIVSAPPAATSSSSLGPSRWRSESGLASWQSPVRTAAHRQPHPHRLLPQAPRRPHRQTPLPQRRPRPRHPTFRGSRRTSRPPPRPRGQTPLQRRRRKPRRPGDERQAVLDTGRGDR